MTNVNIGRVENIILNGIDIYEVYGGSSYGENRWKTYDGSQRRATPIIAGYSLPDTKVVEGGLDFKLPNGKHTGYINNIVFNDVNVLVKGGKPLIPIPQKFLLNSEWGSIMSLILRCSHHMGFGHDT